MTKSSAVRSIPRPSPSLNDASAWLEFGVRVQKTGLGLHHEITAALDRSGIDQNIWQILFHLKRQGGPIRQLDLVRALGVARLALGNALQEAERVDLIARVYDPDDRRVKRIELTPEGRHIAQRIETVIGEICDRFSARVSEEDAAVCLRVLGQVQVALDQ